MSLARVIFVDIDGPMIPSYMYLGNIYASHERDFSVHAVKALNEFCERTSAQIVFNSFHNYQTSVHRAGDGEVLKNDENLRDAATRNGILSKYIHSDWRTKYAKLGALDRIQSRHGAIVNWMDEHPDVNDWIAIDDADFTVLAAGKQILIDFDYGFTVKELNVALQKFNSRPLLIGV